MQWPYRFLSLFWLVLVLGISGCGHEPPSESNSKATAAPDGVFGATEVSLQPWPTVVRAQGNLIEDEQATVSSKVAGRVQEVLVDLGSAVEVGQPIAVLETREFKLLLAQAEAEVSQARASIGLRPGVPDEQLDPQKSPPVLQEKAMLEDARINYQRAQSLIAGGVVTKEELQTRQALLRVAEARYDAAVNGVQEKIALLGVRKAQLAIAQQKLEDAVIRAPFTGKIQARHVAPGSYLNVGQAVVELVRTDPLRFRAGIPERSASRVREGQSIRVYVEGHDAPLEATLSRVSPALETSSRALTVEADLPNPSGVLRTGLFAEADVVVGPQDKALAILEQSVVAFAGVEKVWVVRDNQASGQQIRTGRRSGEMIEVLDGLAAGDIILVRGEEGREGQIQITMEEPAAAAATDSSVAVGARVDQASGG